MREWKQNLPSSQRTKLLRSNLKGNDYKSRIWMVPLIFFGFQKSHLSIPVLQKKRFLSLPNYRTVATILLFHYKWLMLTKDFLITKSITVELYLLKSIQSIIFTSHYKARQETLCSPSKCQVHLNHLTINIQVYMC